MISPKPPDRGIGARTPIRRGGRYASLFVSEKEHPARTAGRYVRAAGIAFKKERARLAAESERKRAEEAARAAQAAQLAAQQAALAPPQAPPPPAAQPAPAPAPAKAGRQPAPPPPSNRFLDTIFWILFWITIGGSVIVMLSIENVLSGSTKTITELVLTCIFFTTATTLLLNYGHAKDRVVTGITKRLWGLDHPTTRAGRFMRSIARDVLTLLAIVWLGLAVLELGRLLNI